MENTAMKGATPKKKLSLNVKTLRKMNEAELHGVGRAYTSYYGCEGTGFCPLTGCFCSASQ